MRWWKMAAAACGVGLIASTLKRPRHAVASSSDTRQRSTLVDEAGEQSFPASDPPPWTLGTDG